MKVRYSPADEGGCGHYRLIWPALVLADEGHDVHRATPHVDPDTDVVVIQRPLRRVWADSAIPALQAAGVAVVVEIDDDFDTIDPHNSAWRACHPRWNPDSNRDHLRRAAQQADLVTVSTPALQARYGGLILPNYIPAHYLQIQAERSDLLLGWTGTPMTHPGDLDVARIGVQQALRSAPDWTFQAIGSTATLTALGIEGTVAPWTSTIDEYPNAYAKLSAAIVPLNASPFNEAKSWLKGLEAAALGVPFIASPTGPYRDLHALGAGLLADRRKDWTRQLRRLLTDPILRTDLTDAGRAVASCLTVEAHAWKWMEAWATARARYEQKAAA